MRPEILAESLALSVKGLLEPIVAALERERATVAGLQTRLAALEHVGKDLDTLAALVATVQTQVVALTTLATTPGRPGPPGPPGLDGKDGKDGAPGLVYCGVYVRGKTYTRGELVTAGGSAFHCERETTAAPGHSSDWVLMVKRGRDASDRGGHTP